MKVFLGLTLSSTDILLLLFLLTLKVFHQKLLLHYLIIYFSFNVQALIDKTIKVKGGLSFKIKISQSRLYFRSKFGMEYLKSFFSLSLFIFFLTFYFTVARGRTNYDLRKTLGGAETPTSTNGNSTFRSRSGSGTYGYKSRQNDHGYASSISSGLWCNTNSSETNCPAKLSATLFLV